MSFAAVFSPTPGTPGILSMESPISARRSGICSGVTPIFTFTAASSSTTRSPPRPLVVKTRTRGLHELEHVLVGGDEDDVDGRIPHAIDERAQHVVGLEARDLEQGHPQRLEQPPHVRNLDPQIVRGGRARLLVRGELRLAKARPRRIPRGHEVLGRLLPQELPDHGRRAEHDVARQALRGGEIGQRVVGAIHVARGVEDEQALGHGDSRL
jgi:hypothetical protein